MRKPLLLIFTNACLVVAVFALLAQSLFVVRRVARTGKIQGVVWVQHGSQGTFTPLREGDIFRTGDTVRTGPDSFAELGFLDGTRWKLFAKTQITLQEAMIDTTKKSEVSRLQLESGQILLRLAKNLSPGSRLEIETPGAVALTRGQVLEVSVRPDATSFDVLQGSTNVQSKINGESFFLTSGKQALGTVTGWKVHSRNSRAPVDLEADFLKPALNAEVRDLGDGKAVLTGQAEPDSQLKINEKEVPVAETGAWLLRVKLATGTNTWEIESTDAFGATNSLQKSLNFKNHCAQP